MQINYFFKDLLTINLEQFNLILRYYAHMPDVNQSTLIASLSRQSDEDSQEFVLCIFRIICTEAVFLIFCIFFFFGRKRERERGERNVTAILL